jgi:Ca2+-binding RTX toxin-like protein
MGRRIGKIAVLGAAALILGLIAAPGASAAPPATCLNLSTFLPPAQVEQPVATIVGTNGSDVLRGTSGPDVIAGLDGNDVIAGLGGDDIICGGRGNDKIDGGARC